MIALVSVYAPNNVEKEFFRLLTETILDLTKFKVIVGADFNAISDHILERPMAAESKV